MSNQIQIKQGDCLELMKKLEDNSIDAIITDPPYGLLKGHRIETDVDINNFSQEAYRLLKNNSFYVFFGRMPSILNWHNEAIKAGFSFKIDIIWNKKNGFIRQKNQLENIIELIWVYKKGNAKFNRIEYPYEQVFLNNVQNGAKTTSILRNLSYWKGIAQGKILNNKTRNNKKVNDDFYYRKECSEELQAALLGKENINIKNIWAENSHNCANRNPLTGQIKHPTVKPIPIMKKLIELTTIKNQTTLDPFMGSGTTGIACVNLDRNFIGYELDSDYFQIAETRIQNAKNKIEEYLI